MKKSAFLIVVIAALLLCGVVDKENCEGEIITVMYEMSGNQAIPANDSTLIDFDNKLWDAPGDDRVTIGPNWRFVSDLSQVYNINVSISINSANGLATDHATAALYLNNELYMHFDNFWVVSALPPVHRFVLQGNISVPLLAGDYIHVEVYHDMMTGVFAVDSDSSFIDIKEVVGAM